MRHLAMILCACAMVTSASAKERQIVDPLAAGLVPDNYVVAVEVIIAPTAAEKMAEFEMKAAEKRAAINLPAAVPSAPAAAATPASGDTLTPAVSEGSIPVVAEAVVRTSPAPALRPAKDQYDTLPFAQMFPLVIEDVTREWGLAKGRPIKLSITVDTLKTANAGMAILFGSSDQLAGMVAISDPATNEKLGSFYIDVLNAHSGLMGLAMRGAGIREKLAEEFALQTSRVLTGRKSKTPKRTKA